MERSSQTREEALLLTEIASLKARVAELERTVQESGRLWADLPKDEDIFRILAENTSANIWIGDLTGATKWVSRSISQSLGYSPEEFIKLPPSSYITPESWTKFSHIMTAQLSPDSSGQAPLRAQSFEIEAIRKDGARVWLEVKADFLRDRSGKPIGIHGLSHDITERRRYLEELRYSEDRFRRAANLLSDHILEVKLDSGEVKWFGDVDGLLGYAPGEYPRDLAKNNEKIHPEDRPRVLRSVARQIKTGAPFREEFRVRKKNGDYLMISCRGEVLRNESGKPTTWLGVSSDVTEAHKSEQSLRASEERYRMLAENASDMIWTMDLNFINTYLSPSIERVLGWKLEEHLNQSLELMLAPASFAYVKKILGKLLEAEAKGLNPRDASYNMELEFKRKDGSPFRGEVVATFLRDEASGRPTGVHGVTRDITLRHQVEEERRRTQKLESIGILAGGIAHDFNNILAALMLSISYGKTMVDPSATIHDLLTEAETATQRARDLTNQLLTFSKGGAPIMEVSSIAEIIRESAAFVMHGSHIKCEFFIPDQLWPVKVDKGQISQVLHNIVINACQAMADTGSIYVSAENTVRARNQNPELAAGRYVAISVRDEGRGIPPEILAKIFDPFFTTKNQGNGLGLATSYSIVKKHGGLIAVNSKLGEGSTFTIYLPAAREAQAKKPQPEDGAGSKLVPVKILLMDDEEPIRKTISNALGGTGFEIVCAADGERAVQCYRQAQEEGRPFDLVILDLTVPGGKGGLWTIEQLRELNPHVKALVASGYSNSPVVAHYENYGFKGMITKPFDFESLTEAIRKSIL